MHEFFGSGTHRASDYIGSLTVSPGCTCECCLVKEPVSPVTTPNKGHQCQSKRRPQTASGSRQQCCFSDCTLSQHNKHNAAIQRHCSVQPPPEYQPHTQGIHLQFPRPSLRATVAHSEKCCAAGTPVNEQLQSHCVMTDQGSSL